MDLLGGASLPASPEVGRLLYLLDRSQGSRCIVELGASFGVSTFFLACAARDNRGHVVSSELHPAKVRSARQHLREAGLSDWGEVREGGALHTLRNLEGPIDFLFLDGWKSLYLPVLKLSEPRLRIGALVAADLNIAAEALAPFLEYVREPGSGYALDTLSH